MSENVEQERVERPKRGPARPRLLIADLGWTREEAVAVRAKLAAFEEDWDVPEMDIYDTL